MADRNWLERVRDHFAAQDEYVGREVERISQTEGYKSAVDKTKETFKSFGEERGNRNWRDRLKFMGNVANWEKEFVGGLGRAVPRMFGYDFDFGPMDDPGEIRDRLSLITDRKDLYDPEKQGIGALRTMISGEGWMGKLLGGKKEEISLANKDSAANEFLKRYETPEAFGAYINDNFNEDIANRAKILTDRDVNWDDWVADNKYADPSKFDEDRNSTYAWNIEKLLLDPYLSHVGEQYRESMMDQFGGYDLGNAGYLNMGTGNEKMKFQVPTVNPEWAETFQDDDPENDMMFPEEFNFGVWDPLVKSDMGYAFEYSPEGKKFYTNPLMEIPAMAVTGIGGWNILNKASRKLPYGKVARTVYPGTVGKRPVIGALQAGIGTLASDLAREKYYYPGE